MGPRGQDLDGFGRRPGAVYSTAASFDGGAGALAFDDGECTCPVGYNCKHVAAVVIAAANDRGQARAATTLPRPPRRMAAALAPSPPSWERPLRALIDTPAAPETGSPLAIELALHRSGTAGGGALRLMARLKRPGVRGGWVNGSLSWNDLDSWRLHSAEYREDPLELARGLYALRSAQRPRTGYYYGYGAEKTLDLSDCNAQLWPLPHLPTPASSGSVCSTQSGGRRRRRSR